MTATIDSSIETGSTAGLVKLGDGTLIITGNAPDVVVESGALEVTSTGSIGNLTINDGTVFLTGTMTGDLILNGGTLAPGLPGDFDASNILHATDIDALYAQVPPSLSLERTYASLTDSELSSNPPLVGSPTASKQHDVLNIAPPCSELVPQRALVDDVFSESSKRWLSRRRLGQHDLINQLARVT